MTAFGQVIKKIPCLGKVHLEIRSLNHRYLEFVFHLPEGFSFLEEKIKKELEKDIYRGRVNIFLNFEESKFLQPQINQNLAKKYYQKLKGLRNDLGLNEEPSLKILLNLPGVVNLVSDEEKKKNLWPALRRCFVQLKKSFLQSRREEGRALAGDLRKRIKLTQALVKKIKKHLPSVIKSKTKELCIGEELGKVLKDIDISEELMRIEFHLNSFSKKLLKNNAPIGKELDFITQEIQREANTIAAKSQDALISAQVVDIKSQIEKVREQLQNVE